VISWRQLSLLLLCTSLLAATERQNGLYELLCLAFGQAWDLIEVRAIKGLTDISISLILSWLMFVRPLLLRVLYPDVSMDVSYSCKVTMAVRHLLNTCATVEHRVPVASTVCCLIAHRTRKRLLRSAELRRCCSDCPALGLPDIELQ